MFRTAVSTAIALAVSTAAYAQTPVTPVAESAAAASASRPAAVPPNVAGGITPPADYVIGINDSLDVVYWQDKDMSATVVVRPDGNISLPLLNDVKAAGLTPEELRAAVVNAAGKFVEQPTVSIVVKEINSRKVYVTGQVDKPGSYPLTDATNVLQMLATAGGLSEYAKGDKITIVRRENGKDVAHKFNYKKISEGKLLEQNITLKPGDTIVVP